MRVILCAGVLMTCMALDGQGETQRHVDEALGCVCRYGGP